mmetsp:Transcript_12900/g.51478  ORF Transcript_12900/g.51478 Transcript_12900/m.51478 type:complete len:91 (-) Transcript_12900:127-399(-)
MTTNLTDGSLNSLDISKKSTSYTFIAEKGPIVGFQSHDDPVRMPLPPFNEETALQKVKAAENAWNTWGASWVRVEGAFVSQRDSREQLKR